MPTLREILAACAVLATVGNVSGQVLTMYTISGADGPETVVSAAIPTSSIAAMPYIPCIGAEEGKPTLKYPHTLSKPHQTTYTPIYKSKSSRKGRRDEAEVTRTLGEPQPTTGTPRITVSYDWRDDPTTMETSVIRTPPQPRDVAKENSFLTPTYHSDNYHTTTRTMRLVQLPVDTNAPPNNFRAGWWASESYTPEQTHTHGGWMAHGYMRQPGQE